MKRYRYVIIIPEGLQGRLAVKLAEICQDAESCVTVNTGSKHADGKKALMVMSLCARHGDELEFLVDGSDEEEVLQQIEIFCEKYL